MAVLASDGTRFANGVILSLDGGLGAPDGPPNLSVSIVASERNPREKDDTSDQRIASLRRQGISEPTGLALFVNLTGKNFDHLLFENK